MRLVEIPLCQTQREFLWALVSPDSPYNCIGFGGARRGGKTAVSCLGMVVRRIKHPGTKGLILRKTEKAAVANIRDEIKKWCRKLNVRFQWKAVEKIFVFPDYDDSEIHLGYCRTESDYENYIGLQYDDICFEEATQHSKMAWDLVGGSNFPNRPGVRAKRWASTNPGGPGHGWYKRLFVNPDTRPENVAWIPSLLRDALPVLEIDPGYYGRVLAPLPEWKRRQWADGDWDVMAGSYFDLPPGTIREVAVPVYAKWYAGVDWGFWPDPFAVVWLAFWTDERGRNRLHVERCYRGYRMNPDVQGYRALEIEEDIFLKTNRPIKGRFADPSVWRRQETKSTEAGRTISSMWADVGFHAAKARTNARIPGWQTIRQLIANKNLTIDPGCVELIEELTDAVQEGTPENPEGEDVHEDCEDHLLDALRYACVSLMYGRTPPPPEESYAQFQQHALSYADVAPKRKIR